MNTSKSMKQLLAELAVSQKREAEIKAAIAAKSDADLQKLAGVVGPSVARMVQRDSEFAALLAAKMDRLMIEDGIMRQRDRDAKMRLLLRYCPQKKYGVKGDVPSVGTTSDREGASLPPTNDGNRNASNISPETMKMILAEERTDGDVLELGDMAVSGTE